MKVWDMPAGVVGGRVVSLNDIEHVELRGTWNEPKLHACIVCASVRQRSQGGSEREGAEREGGR